MGYYPGSQCEDQFKEKELTDSRGFLFQGTTEELQHSV